VGTKLGLMKAPERQRCTECRKWFVPHVACGERQRTCSRACRRGRRREQARRRRAARLDEARAEERARQRRCRARRRERAGADAEPVSRAGLGVKVAGIVERILEDWDEQSARSRASLRRQTTRILGEMTRHVGHGVPVSRADLDGQMAVITTEDGRRMGHGHGPGWAGTRAAKQARRRCTRCRTPS